MSKVCLTSPQGVGTGVVLGGGGAWRRPAASDAWSSQPVCRRLGGLEAARLRDASWRFWFWRPPFSYASRKRRRAATPRSRRRPHGLTAAIGFCGAKAGSSRESLGAEARTGAASPVLYSTRLRYYLSAASRRLYRETLHSYERRLAWRRAEAHNGVRRFVSTRGGGG